MRKHFKFQLKDDYIRGMNRQEYKKASRWARLCGSICELELDWDAVGRHITETIISGYAKINFDDLIKP